MIDFIPLENYFGLYINLLLVVSLLCLLNSFVLPVNSVKNLLFTNLAGYSIFFGVILYLGLRPINGHYFGDTINYATHYYRYILGGEILSDKDIFFHVFMKFCAGIVNIHIFFVICMFLYVYPLFRISKKLFKEYWFYAFFMFVVSFSFWTYGVNGVRNGIATSFFLWGLCYKDKKIIMALFFILSASFHKTMLLPIFAFLITYLYNNPKFIFVGWLTCIPLSLILSSVWISFFSSIGFADDRLTGYLTSEAESGTFASTGFRWDFLFHSAFAVFAGWYFIYKKKFEDKFYYQLLNTYLICNGFWILIIKANYSNRFAYLSWFMMGLIIIYPFLKERFFENQHFMIGKVMFVYFSFTYLMYYLYS
ncbi:EpsG family protein [uncultured Aquimarina sp.]|uniref:EpsG family protein n=1 Tax=uncultured Aquimarina sp. TaxID=575652 RepID=UPI00262D0A24|nr:EpsG family protein [uncultured Aquimarina sp.]